LELETYLKHARRREWKPGANRQPLPATGFGGKRRATLWHSPAVQGEKHWRRAYSWHCRAPSLD